MVPERAAERDARRESDIVRDREHVAQVGFNQVVPHRECAAQPECPSRQQQVLTCRIDRGSFVRAGCPIPAQACDHHHRHPFERIDIVLHGRSHSRLRRCEVDPGPSFVSVVRSLGGPRAAKRSTEQRSCSGGPLVVAQHDESERLTVAAARRTSRVPEDGRQILVRYWIVGVSTDRPSRGETVQQSDRRRHTDHPCS